MKLNKTEKKTQGICAICGAFYLEEWGYCPICEYGKNWARVGEAREEPEKSL